MEIIGNKGLIILEKTDTNIKLMTCAGYFVEDGVEEQIIAKTQRLNMRIVNAAVLEDNQGIYVLEGKIVIANDCICGYDRKSIYI